MIYCTTLLNNTTGEFMKYKIAQLIEALKEHEKTYPEADVFIQQYQEDADQLRDIRIVPTMWGTMLILIN